jgi:AcrR family transcriptional regulator
LPDNRAQGLFIRTYESATHGACKNPEGRPPGPTSSRPRGVSSRERGFDGTSVRAITRDAGTNLGAVTYHFGSKHALYAAVLEQGLRPLAERVRAAASSEGTALERMLRVVEAYFDHFEAHPDLPHLLLQEVAAGKKPPPVVLEILRSAMEAIAGLQAAGAPTGRCGPATPSSPRSASCRSPST